ncbi:hypothetical protein ABMD20_07890 [Weissella confusa]|uniref:hypothetical protein n=1 Tax=Weissella confusa TaxID=1583 RepID=UPI00396F62CC
METRVTHARRTRTIATALVLVFGLLLFAGVVTALETTAIAAQQSSDLTTMSTSEVTAEQVIAK